MSPFDWLLCSFAFLALWSLGGFAWLCLTLRYHLRQAKINKAVKREWDLRRWHLRVAGPLVWLLLWLVFGSLEGGQ